MKILIYGLQSSGASLFCYFIAQKAGSIGIVDLNNHRVAPNMDIGLDVALKVVITTNHSLADHIASFNPDKIILFLRNPYNNYYSLRDKSYASKSGGVDEKFALLEHYFTTDDLFDQVVTYEDFIHDRAATLNKINVIGWQMPPNAYIFPRSPREIFLFNNLHSEWCRNNPAAPGPQGGWGMGNLSGAQINPTLSEKPYVEEINDKIKILCPSIHAFYTSRNQATSPILSSSWD